MMLQSELTFGTTASEIVRTDSGDPIDLIWFYKITKLLIEMR